MAATSPKEPKFEATGTADLAARPLVLNVARLSWQSQALTFKNKTPFTVRLLPGWEISPATFQVDGGSVTVAGLARDQQLSGVLEVRDLDAGLLAPLGLPASGKLNGRLTLAGTPGTPIIDGQIALSNGKVKNLPIQTLTTTLNYQAEQAQVAGYPGNRPPALPADLEEGRSRLRSPCFPLPVPWPRMAWTSDSTVNGSTSPC